MEAFIGKTAVSTMETGKMENKMEKDCSKIKVESINMESGVMEREKNGSQKKSSKNKKRVKIFPNTTFKFQS